MPPTRCGYVALIGAPNSGKSTLLNRVVGRKLAIVTPKAQTTRNRLLGIAIEGPAQIVFVDTPGIFAPRRRLDRAMVAAAWSGAEDADEALLLVDAFRGIDRDTRRILDRLAGRSRRSILALNKIDLVARESLLGLTDALSREGLFDPIFMISGLKGDGVEDAAGVPIDAPGSVDQQQCFVGVLGARPGRRHHCPIEAASGRKNAGRIDKDDLRRTFYCDAEESIARRLRLRRYDRKLAADEPVEQGRLTRIRGPDQRNIAASGRRGLRFVHRLRPRAVLPILQPRRGSRTRHPCGIWRGG